MLPQPRNEGIRSWKRQEADSLQSVVLLTPGFQLGETDFGLLDVWPVEL